jgi:glyoxylase-like metal-dependent hydrolase (beta-lactamase superfamily II)
MINEATQTLATDGAEQSDLFARFSVGDLQCVALSDGYIETPAWILAPEIAAAELGPFLAETGEDIDALRTPITCLFVELPDGRRLLIDSGLGKVPGPGGHAVPTAGLLEDALAAAGIDPASIDHVLVSHIHPDHFGGVFDAAGQPNFPNATYSAPREDVEFWAGDAPDLSGTMMPPPLQMGTVQNAKRFLGHAGDRINLFPAGEQVMDRVGSIHLPGHTPGQVGFLIDGGSDSLFFSADAAGHPTVSVQHPDWRFAFDTDAPLAIDTRRKMIEMLAGKGWTTYTPHFSWPGVGRFVHTDAGIRWQALR